MSTVISSQPNQNAFPLPPEMIDYVIDFLHEDTPSLRSCSLVARAFVASSQLHLFHSLLFNCRGETGFTYIVEHFCEHPHLRSYVRRVFICPGRRELPSLPQPDTICLCIVTNILSTFPHLRVFTINSISLDSRECCLVPPTRSFSMDIARLDLENVVMYSHTYSPAINIFNLFSTIQSLYIDEVLTTDGLVGLSLSRSPSLTSLTIGGYLAFMVVPFVRALSNYNMLNNLKDLRVSSFKWEDFDVLSSITIASAKSLVKLTLDMSRVILRYVYAEASLPSFPPNTGRWQPLGLSSLHSLRSFETAVTLLEPRNDSDSDSPTLELSVRAFHHMLDLLSELPRNLEELSIFLHVGNQAYVNVISQDFNWDRLVSMIHSFPLIKMVNIVIISNWDDFVEVASRCSQIVLDALHFYNRGEHEVIRVSCVLGDYDDPLSYRNLL